MIRALRNTVRLLRIGRTLARHDALFPLELFPAYPLLGWVSRIFSRKGVPGRPGERLAAALHEMGPSFIKLGQTLATRSDLIGEEISADLSRLQDRLPPFPGVEARRTIELELGQPLESLFAAFDEAPVAAASISQVHFAETLEGEKVAVKVLRPGIELAFARDLDLFAWIAALVERTQPQLRRLKPREVVAIFAATVRAEMDLRFEAAAAAELAENFADYDGFRVPRIDWPRTARRVLTLERIDGHRIDDVEILLAAGHDPDLLLKRSAEVFFLQVFRDGFFHADMHPGNMFVDAAGDLRPVDFGIMGRLDVKTRYFLADMMVGFLNGDYRRVAEVHFQAGYVPADQSIDDFTQACRSIGAPILGRPLHEISVARLLAQLFQVTEAFQMETQPQLLLLQKTMLVAEGVGRRLNPRLNMWELARPLIERWMREHRGPEARIRQAALDIGHVVERLPALLGQMERAADRLADPAGVKLHPDTAAALLRRRRAGLVAQWPVWAALALVLAIALLS
ncbi:2-polyprenylphenol 6-hydroxylase [Oceanibaculum pacificum]|uniref:2-octaprenylphenol hydroxylase n=1 Tax=Oceanibaculum pacificum TaxID=580166 RepID=A0A154WHC8_9PROT|nr:2-polyprenylphenol 6-hydroxylase [Oceanibaculum pacificum]KZD12896.1 2-octaprenylphenol hydroxylase [Oceanibaculum pacificum]